MKALFVHDNQFLLDEKKIYSNVQFPSSVWERYLAVFDSLVVVGREMNSEIADIDQLVRSDAPSVRFVLAPNLSSLKSQIFQKKKALETIRQEIDLCDVVIVRLHSELGLLAAKAADKAGKSWAAEVVACAFDALWYYGTLKGKLYAPIMALRTRKAVSMAPYVLYVTKHFLQKRYPNTKGVITHCSNVSIPEPSNMVLEKRLERIKRNEKPIVLGLIGTLRTKFKGIQTVIQALSQSKASMPFVLFRVLGDGDPEPWIQEAKKHNVDQLIIFDGTLPPGDAVLSWLDSIDVYLQPSLHEGLPRALIEAMNRGCPVLASSCAGIPELIDHSCTFTPGNDKQLSKLLEKYVDDIQWKLDQSKINWENSQEYSNEILEQRRITFWRDISNNAKENKFLNHKD